tara:strand:+ start:710 stop:1201 length:492 start_codon:yes stop_codon:yes gene_type:complete
MKNHILSLILITSIFSGCSKSQKESEEKFRAEINNLFHKNLSDCNTDVSAITDFNGKPEFWKICELNNESQIIQIESHKDSIFYQEIYFSKNGDLIYAKETENYMPNNSFNQMAWNCEFYARNGELISLISLGHGKTEDEEWDSDIIFEMYNKRIEEIKRIEK